MKDHSDLIASLSGQLEPVKPAPDINFVAMVWLLFSAVYLVAVTHWFGPIRSTALDQLALYPRFALESLAGLVAIVLVCLAAFRAVVPGLASSRLVTVAAGLTLLWIGSYIVGLASPALEPSMLGKRDHCFLETVVYAVPPLLAALYLGRRFYPLRPLRTAASLGLAAGMMPALYMQIACMYEPGHILAFHIAPGLAVAAVGLALAWAWYQMGEVQARS